MHILGQILPIQLVSFMSGSVFISHIKNKINENPRNNAGHHLSAVCAFSKRPSVTHLE